MYTLSKLLSPWKYKSFLFQLSVCSSFSSWFTYHRTNPDCCLSPSTKVLRGPKCFHQTTITTKMFSLIGDIPICLSGLGPVVVVRFAAFLFKHPFHWQKIKQFERDRSVFRWRKVNIISSRERGRERESQMDFVFLSIYKSIYRFNYQSVILHINLELIYKLITYRHRPRSQNRSCFALRGRESCRWILLWNAISQNQSLHLGPFKWKHLSK